MRHLSRFGIKLGLKIGSLWDIPRPELDSSVWTPEEKLQPQHRKFLFDFAHNVFNKAGFKSAVWLDEVLVLGSIASYQYSRRSDVDLHFVVDLKKMVEAEYHGEMTEEQAHEAMDALRKSVNQTPTLLPGTTHPIEITFHYRGLAYPALPTNVGLYDLVKDEWRVRPVRGPLAGTGVEKIYPDLLEAVYSFAKKYEIQLVEMRKDVVDIQYLQESLSQFPPQYHEAFQQEIEAKVEDLNNQIDEYLARTEEMVERRHGTPFPVMPAELQQKYLARYGWLWLGKRLKELRPVSESDIPELEQKLREVPKLSA